MPDFPAAAILGSLHTYGLSTLGLCGITPGVNGIAPVSNAWPAANRAIFVPVRVPIGVTVYKMGCGTGTGTTGNFALGIYDAGGNLIVSTGSTAKTTASSERVIDITDTYLGPGLYYLAMAVDDTGPYNSVALGTARVAKLMGVREMETAFPLPGTATFATTQAAYIPNLTAYVRAE